MWNANAYGICIWQWNSIALEEADVLEADVPCLPCVVAFITTARESRNSGKVLSTNIQGVDAL